MFLLGVMVGVIQILIAVFKLGDLTRYISESVVIGFMAGAGFLVALGQVGNLLGIKERGTGDQHVLLRFWLTVSRGGTPSQYAVVIGVGVIVLAVDSAQSGAPLSSAAVGHAAGADRDGVVGGAFRLVRPGGRRQNTDAGGRARAGESLPGRIFRRSSSGG
jgi:hypothetical protein